MKRQDTGGLGAKISSSSNLLARPGQSLLKHLEGSARRAQNIACKKETTHDLTRAAYLIGASHDFGKATTFFQDYVSGVERRPSTQKTQHSSLSAFFCYHLLKKEVAGSLPVLGWYIIQRHHSNLTDLNLDPDRGEIYRKVKKKAHKELLKEQARNILENNIAELQDIYDKLEVDVCIEDFLNKILDESVFQDLLIDFYRGLKRDAVFETYFTMLFLYSSLLDSDKMNAAGVEPPDRSHLPGDLVDRYKKHHFGASETVLNKLREEAYRSVLEKLGESDLGTRRFSITLPTGMGKTFTGLQAAFQLRERIYNAQGFEPRIIYSLPFLSIIEQNYDVLEAVLESSSYPDHPDILLKHHYLSTGYTGGEGSDGDFAGILLTEGWHSEIVVTTFIQFFESLITHRNSRARKFHNMANSVIILDEVQTIPRKYWELLKESLIILCEEYNSWIILMTATNPLIFEPGDEIKELVESKERYYNALDRVEYVFDLEEKNLEDLGEEVIDCFKENPESDIMIVLNTINSSKLLYRMLKDAIGEEKDLEYIYLSTHVLPSERLKRIEQIKRDKTRLLIVTTQLVEAGVDIDVDIIYRDLSPLDSIIQTAGRCNRENSRKKGNVHLKKLKDGKTGRPYSSYIYDGVLLDITEELLGDTVNIPERDFNLQYANRYFKMSRKRGSRKQDLHESIKDLRYSDIQQFKLIEEEHNTLSFFIEIDKKASEIRKKTEELLKGTFGYKRKALFQPLKRDFYNYVLQVRVPKQSAELVEYLQPLENFKDIYIVENRVLGDWYNEETGFQFPEDTIEFRLI